MSAIVGQATAAYRAARQDARSGLSDRASAPNVPPGTDLLAQLLAAVQRPAGDVAAGMPAGPPSHRADPRGARAAKP